MSGQPPGTYQLCGFSYDNGSAPLVSTLIGQNYSVISTLFDSGMGTFCGDFSTDCFDLIIGPAPMDIVVDTMMCINDCFTTPTGSQCCSPGTCTYQIDTGGGCTQNVTYNITPNYSSSNYAKYRSMSRRLLQCARWYDDDLPAFFAANHVWL